jgi:tetrathionate reductase subunit B
VEHKEKDGKMTRYAMLIDTSKCIGCHTCTVACRDQFVINDWPPYSAAQPDGGHFWMFVEEKIWGKAADASTKARYIAEPCMLCDDPPCVKAATDGAAYKRPDGIVIIDPVKSKGQQQIVDSCPYGRIYWNDQLQIPQKCTSCVHRLERGTQPACVVTCPTQALQFGDETELASLIADKKAKVLSPELGVNPKVYYAGLPE